MGRIKINLDQLEEVREQYEIAMNVTEDVISKAREDLNSMAEEVWEGEDGDMARDLFGDLVYKEMPETWKHIDASNEAIKKAQKKAYEAKNYCNDFPKIFKGGEPSEGNQSPCSGDLLCDPGSCAELKHNMANAGQNAANLKNRIKEVADILSQLETPEAKFNYTSYTQPIIEQAQDVEDYTRNFNEDLTKYEAKVNELDSTLSKELLAAVPETVEKPFDPSCLLGEDTIHMQGGDIINTLEEHNSIDIGSKLSDAQLENILAMLFDKKDIDVSGLSEEDLGMAFITLPEEKKKAVLFEMGYTKEQIDSILESYKGHKSTAAGTDFGRTLVEKITDKYGNPFDRLGNEEKDSKSESSGTKPGQNNNAVYTSAELNDVTIAGGGATPEQVQEWVETGDTESMNEYIEETSQNVDQWDEYKAANLAAIYEWSLQSGNTEVAENFARHFQIVSEDSKPYNGTGSLQIHTFTMNADALDAIYNSFPKSDNNEIRDSLEELKKASGNYYVAIDPWGTEAYIGNMKATLNDDHQIQFSYDEQNGKNIVVATSAHSILDDTPSYVIDYWIDSKDKDKLCAYIEATPDDDNNWDSARATNLGHIWVDSISNSGNEDILETFVDHFVIDVNPGDLGYEGDMPSYTMNTMALGTIYSTIDKNKNGEAYWTLVRVANRRDFKHDYLYKTIDNCFDVTFTEDGHYKFSYYSGDVERPFTSSITSADITEQINMYNLKTNVFKNSDGEYSADDLNDFLKLICTDYDLEMVKKLAEASIPISLANNTDNPFNVVFDETDPNKISATGDAALFKYAKQLLKSNIVYDNDSGKINVEQTERNLKDSIFENMLNSLLCKDEEDCIYSDSDYRKDYLDIIIANGIADMFLIETKDMVEDCLNNDIDGLKEDIISFDISSQVTVLLETFRNLINKNNQELSIQVDNLKLNNSKMNDATLFSDITITNLNTGENETIIDFGCGVFDGSKIPNEKTKVAYYEHVESDPLLDLAISTAISLALCFATKEIGIAYTLATSCYGLANILSTSSDKPSDDLMTIFYGSYIGYGPGGSSEDSIYAGGISAIIAQNANAALRQAMVIANGYSALTDGDINTEDTTSNNIADGIKTDFKNKKADAAYYAKLYFVFTGHNINDDYNYTWEDVEPDEIIAYQNIYDNYDDDYKWDTVGDEDYFYDEKPANDIFLN
ncbi:hypothetical protein SAMN02745229_00030 [Butyrivibrio fibrisolvens DSM 3071]|uniref:Uncharacterized protein n=3 Tax=Butyrivibrio fibrisolvens TaxID=831 RepID=A0A1M5PLP1_BUTFI|nr:hypothetical protein SAMN02745229_00030 [Butyrivibrio fibrisolvens DSM 3071]